MEKTNKWTVKDVITTVLLTVLLIIIQLIVNMVCMANDFVSMVLSVGITMLLCAPVYFLMVSRVHKRFVSLIYMTILGLVFLIMGNWYLLPYYMLVGVICEMILWKNGWESKKKLTAAWTVSSLLYNGVNLLPIWFFWDTYEAFALSSGMEQSYIDSFVRYLPQPDGWRAGRSCLPGGSEKLAAAALLGAFYALLAVLFVLDPFHGLHMVVFSEFYVLMFWNLSRCLSSAGICHHAAWRNFAAFPLRFMPSSVY